MRKCQGKCKLDQETRLCLGCQRSIYEIKQAYKEYVAMQNSKGDGGSGF